MRNYIQLAFQSLKNSLSKLTEKEAYLLFSAVVLACFINLLVFVGIMLSRPNVHTEIGTVNLTGIVHQYIQTTAKQGLSDAELKKRTEAFGEALQSAVDKFSETNDVILLPSEAVVSGAPDYTNEITAQLFSVPNTKQSDTQQRASLANTMGGAQK